MLAFLKRIFRRLIPYKKRPHLLMVQFKRVSPDTLESTGFSECVRCGSTQWDTDCPGLPKEKA